MVDFTPPPRQQVLYGIKIQAEQARNLVEDIQAGSDSAPGDLLNVASQILARARMYQWPRVVLWASALEEKLAAASVDEGLSTSEVDWLGRHVERLDEVLSESGGKTKASDSSRPTDFDDAEDSSELFLAFDEGSSEEMAPEGALLTMDGEASLELDYDMAFDDSPIPETVESEWEHLGMTPVPGPPEPELAPPDAETPVPGEVETASPEAETPVPGEIEPASPGAETPVPGEIEPASPDAETPPPSEVEPASPEAETPAPDQPAPAPDESATPMPEEAEADSEASDKAAPATLGKLDIKRRTKRRRPKHKEIQGPEQYIVVSIASEPEVHMWLGRMLPERRFELLAARGPAEAEILCREHQPDLVLMAWDDTTDTAQQTLARIRENPLTRYVRVALVTKEDDLPSQLAATRLGAMGIIPQSAKPKSVISKVLLCVLAPEEVPGQDLGQTTMNELSELLLKELRLELEGIGGVVGDVVVPVGGVLGQVLRDASRKLRDGVKLALGCDPVAAADGEEGSGEAGAGALDELLEGKRALVMESDRLRCAELARVLGELGLEVLPPMPDLTKALEAGLTWAPDVFVGGAPLRDSETCVRILRRDIALSSMLSVFVRWPESHSQWPDAQADVAALRPWLTLELGQAFAPSAELRRQLHADDLVSGRVESCGMPVLLQTIMVHRGNARLDIAEGTDRFEAFIADGQITDVTWTEADGTETEHFDAFARMLAVTRGRFYVNVPIGDAPELALPGTMSELLTAACHWWRPLGLVIDQRLVDIEPLELDMRRTTELKRQTGKTFRKVVKQLVAGAAPVDIIESGAAPDVVAQVLRELVRRLAVKELPTMRSSQTTPT